MLRQMPEAQVDGVRQMHHGAWELGAVRAGTLTRRLGNRGLQEVRHELQDHVKE